MNDLYKIWDEFLQRWPIEKVKSMTLEEYSSAGGKDTFTYWLEAKLDILGSIWGGSAFKFGIFSRNTTEVKENAGKRSYDEHYGWYSKEGKTRQEAFENVKGKIIAVIEAVMARDTSMIDAIDLGPAYKWKIAFHYQDRQKPLVLSIFKHNALAELCEEKANANKISEFHQRLLEPKPDDVDLLDYASQLWKKWSKTIEEEQKAVRQLDTIPLNTILYGPPGTGKTYKTVNKALEIICNSDHELKIQIGDMISNPDADRKILERAFYRLIDEKRIKFITFHPSYAYEDFIQGIRPVLDGSDSVSYELKEGPFKEISDLAQAEYAQASVSYDFSDKTEIYKMSLGNSLKPEDNDIYDYCIDNGYIAHGFANGIDFNSLPSDLTWDDARTEIPKMITEWNEAYERHDYATRVIYYFNYYLKNGSIVIIPKGNKKIRAIGKVVGDYEFDDGKDVSYNHLRKVEWLVKNVEIPVEQLLTKTMSQQTLYFMKRDFIREGKLRELLSGKTAKKNKNHQNYVIIIDEINRGNIPRIFGELITLIEDNKRLRYEDNELIGHRVQLPGSNEDDPPFGVPENLYILGTMNTADKSISSLDIALRRRFSFEPMYPISRLIDDDFLRDMLVEINKQICALKDKDHQIGHSFCIGKDETDLPEILNSKVIPLLEEYFFGDTETVKSIFSNVSFPGGELRINDLGILQYVETA
jgi:5-methylcytosine-specific restriction protein B